MDSRISTDYSYHVRGAFGQSCPPFAHQEGQKLGLLVESHPADWGKHGKRAGYVRNAEMVALGADLCIAFWDGRSNGTKHTMDLARVAGIPLEIINVQRPPDPKAEGQDEF